MAGSVPRVGTKFVGRRSSLKRIESLLRDHRLVSLTGVGGSGKTRLALEIVPSLVPTAFPQVAWVELAPLSDPELVVPTTCAALDLRLPPEADPMAALCSHLEGQSLLLVLDNCEHVLDTCANLAIELLRTCSHLKLLVTSRQPLGVPEEVVWAVPTLHLPDPEGSRDRLLDTARRSESVQLFVDRVRSVRPDFQLTSENVEDVVHLCRSLDGIPLALELAAARTRVLAPGQIAERLEAGLGVLGSSASRSALRHRTMRAALDWSHELLAEPERTLFRRLAIFAGSFTLEACESVCVGDGIEQDEMLDLLSRLVDGSLVHVQEEGGSARYRLLEPVRGFALERLESAGEMPSLADRHLAHFMDIAANLAPGLKGPERADVLARLTAEHDNLRRAWDHAMELADGQALARLAHALFWFWNFGGHFGEGRRRTDAALRLLHEDADPVDHRNLAAPADLFWAAGALAWMQGDYAAARDRLEFCVAICRVAGPREVLPFGLRELAGVHLGLGDPAVAAELYREAVDVLSAPEQAWDRALALTVWADAHQALGDGDAAHRLREEAHDLFAQEADGWGRSLAHLGLGLDSARAGDVARARRHATEALALQRAGGDEWNAGQILTLLGEVETQAGNLGKAATLLREAIQAFHAVGDRASLAHGLLCMGEVEFRRGHTLRAIRLAAAADAIQRTLEARYPYGLASEQDRLAVVEALREQLEEETFLAEWAAGGAMSLQAAVATALDTPARSSAVPAQAMDRISSTTLQILSLGGPEVLRGPRRLEPSDWTYALPRELLFFLVMEGPRTKEQIGVELWAEATRDQLRGRFRTALYHLRQALGGTEWVVYRNGRYDFNRDLDYWFDVEAFEERLDRARDTLDSDPVAAAADLEAAVEIHRGEFLEGDSPGRWASIHRDRLRRRYLEALLTLGDHHLEQGAQEAAATRYGQAVETDELNEHAYRGLARARAAAGDRSGAARVLDRLAEHFLEELDLEPSRKTLELRSALEAGSHG